LPTKARLTRFHTKANGDTNTDLARVCTYDIEAEQILPKPTVVDYLPLPPRDSAITDMRFSRVKPFFLPYVTYRMTGTNQFWPSTEAVMKSTAYQEAKRSFRARTVVGRPEGWSIMRIIMVGLFLLPVVIMVLAFSQKLNQTNNKKGINESR
jgi:hypothetical protein